MINKPVLIVDVPNISSLALILTKSKLSKDVLYLRQGRGVIGHMATKLLTACGWTFKQIPLTLLPNGGVSPHKEFEQALIDGIKECKETVLAHHINRLTGVSEYERIRLLNELGKQSALDLYFPMLILTFLFHNNDALPRKYITAVILRRSPFSEVVRCFYQSKKTSVFFYGSPWSSRFIPEKNWFTDTDMLNAGRFNAEAIIRTGFLAIYSFMCKVKLVFSPVRAGFKKHKICALVFNRFSNELSNCFSCGTEEDISIKKETLVLCANIIPEKGREFYKKLSDQLIIFSFNPFVSDKTEELLEAHSHFFGLFLKNMWFYRHLLGWSLLNFRRLKQVITMATYVALYEAIFRTTGTRIVWSTNEFEVQMSMAAVAINRLGGISMGSTWSNPLLPSWGTQRNKHDIHFVWGKRIADIGIKQYDQNHFFVITGYPADRMFEEEFKKAKEFRASLERQAGTRKILTFYDTDSGYDGIVMPDHMLGMYQEFFKWLEEDDANFIIIKSKKTQVLAKYPHLKAKIDELSLKNRIVIIYDRAAIYPGLAADIVMSASTTLMPISGILGRPVIFYDIHGMHEKYPFGLSNARIISHFGEIRTTINAILKDASTSGYSEKLQPIRRSAIDPFVDGQSSQRIRDYIGDVLKMLDENTYKEEAIAYANTRYKDRWGSETVIAGAFPSIWKK